MRQRLQNISIQIRRNDRENKIHRLKQQIKIAQATSQYLQKFISQRHHQVSQSTIQTIHSLSQENINHFIKRLQQQPIIFFEKNRMQDYQWFFDCQSISNLKFMTELRDYGPFNTYTNFFYATIDAHVEYVSSSIRFQLLVQKSQCYILSQSTNQDTLNESSLLSILNRDYNQDRFLAILNFWADHLDKSDNFNFQEFNVMIKTFFVWFEHTEIHEHAETYKFAYQILNVVKQVKLFDKSNKVALQIYNLFYKFYIKIQSFLPFALSIYRFQQLGLILIQFIQFNKTVQGSLSQILYRSQTIIQYLSNIFELDMIPQNIANIGRGIIIVLHLVGNASLLYFKDRNTKNAFLKRFTTEFIFHSQLQTYTIAALTSILENNQAGEIISLFEDINYAQLIGYKTFNNINPICTFVISVLAKFRENYKIAKSILFEGELLDRFEDLNGDNKQMENLQEYYCLLNEIVIENVSFYVDNFIQFVLVLKEKSKNLVLINSSELCQEVDKHLDLIAKESSL